MRSYLYDMGDGHFDNAVVNSLDNLADRIDRLDERQEKRMDAIESRYQTLSSDMQLIERKVDAATDKIRDPYGMGRWGLFIVLAAVVVGALLVWLVRN